MLPMPIRYDGFINTRVIIFNYLKLQSSRDKRIFNEIRMITASLQEHQDVL